VIDRGQVSIEDDNEDIHGEAQDIEKGREHLETRCPAVEVGARDVEIIARYVEPPGELIHSGWGPND